MDIHNDKTLFRFLAATWLVFWGIIFTYAFISYGLAAGLFTIWVCAVIMLYFLIISVTINRVKISQSESFVRSFLSIGVSFWGYRLFKAILFLLFLYATLFMWGFLKKQFPAAVKEPVIIEGEYRAMPLR